MWVDGPGMLPHTVPTPMNSSDVAEATLEFVKAAQLAIEAGFDGIELHAANGYLLEQFLNGNVNKRSDDYGGSAENRNRLVIEVAQATAAAIGADRVGIRVSPYGVFNDTGPFAGMEEQYLALAASLSEIGLVYLHLVDHSSMGAPEVPAEFKSRLRRAFSGSFIASGGFDKATAEGALAEKRGDLVAFGRGFLANPDLIERMKANAPLNPPDMATFYTPGPQGYIDYPTLNG
jgi:N-ethylmaleimide reductase